MQKKRVFLNSIIWLGELVSDIDNEEILILIKYRAP